MSRRVRLVDVAKAAGVSQGTASNVFSRPELVRPEVRARVEAAAAELGYAGPDPRGRMLRAGKVHAIGVVTDDRLAATIDDPAHVIMLAGIAEVCDAHGAGLALVSAPPNDETAPAWTISSALVDGFILFCLRDDDRMVVEARKRRLPFVAVDLDPGEGANAVRIDDVAGARLEVEHLIALGHRKFGILTLELAGDGQFGWVTSERRGACLYSVARERIQGYGAALAGIGVALDDVPMMEVDNDRAAGAAAAAELLARHPDVTAIVAMSDRVALGVLDHARAAGIPVPGRLSVAGYDDIPAAAASNPPLTTIAQPLREKGRRAAAMIFSDDPPHSELIPVRLVARGSTGPAPR